MAAGRCGCWRWRRPPCWRGLQPRVSAGAGGRAGGLGTPPWGCGAQGSGSGSGLGGGAAPLASQFPALAARTELSRAIRCLAKGASTSPHRRPPLPPQAGPQLHWEAWRSWKGPGLRGRFQAQGSSPGWFVFFLSKKSGLKTVVRLDWAELSNSLLSGPRPEELGVPGWHGGWRRVPGWFVMTRPGAGCGGGDVWAGEGTHPTAG